MVLELVVGLYMNSILFRMFLAVYSHRNFIYINLEEMSEREWIVQGIRYSMKKE